MSKFYTSIIIILLSFGNLFSQTDGNLELFKQANQKYTDEAFPEAIASYEQILSTGQESAELYYNLGNAYFKSNQLSRAILNYERGLLLAPSDEDILYNLDIANSLITDRIESIPVFFFNSWVRSIRSSLNPNQWAQLSLLLFIMAIVSIIVFIAFKTRNLRRTALPVIVVGLLLSLLSFVFAQQQARLHSERNTCIVFSPSLTVKSAPDQSGTDLFVIHEGLKLTIKDELSGWYEIEMADGNVGWIPSNAVERI